jgi:triacylglycerol esterase/lipase EstA (alpha/beta hydrolase family)
MKTIILIHGLHMNSLSLHFMKKGLMKHTHLEVKSFNYNSILFNASTIDKFHNFIEKIPLNHEIVLIGHSMGGLVGRLYLTQYCPKRKIKLITLGTPHYGSEVARVIYKTPLKIFLGTSGKSGLLDTIPQWQAQYQTICIAGKKDIGIAKLFAHYIKEPSDGTVFVKEALLDNAHEKVILDDIHHIQLIGHKRVIHELAKWI